MKLHPQLGVLPNRFICATSPPVHGHKKVPLLYSLVLPAWACRSEATRLLKVPSFTARSRAAWAIGLPDSCIIRSALAELLVERLALALR